MFVYLPGGPHGEKVGADDFLAAGGTIDEMIGLACAEPKPNSSGAAEFDPDGAQADVLVDIGRRAELFHDAADSTFSRSMVGDHYEVCPLRSRRYDAWLRRQYFLERGKAPGGEALKAARGVLEGLALYDGPFHPVATRAQRIDGAIWYDLADDRWRVVKIDADGWSVVDDSPARFRRYSHQLAQVLPCAEGDVRAVVM